jgi:hypothetical protein
VIALADYTGLAKAVKFDEMYHGQTLANKIAKKILYILVEQR